MAYRVTDDNAPDVLATLLAAHEEDGIPGLAKHMDLVNGYLSWAAPYIESNAKDGWAMKPVKEWSAGEKLRYLDREFSEQLGL